MSTPTETQSEHNPGQNRDPLENKIIQGHYHIHERVAKGGMAWIYRAEHTTLRNHMAIKILFPQLLEEPDLCERFLEEARIQFGLKHPNIVQVTDVISHDGLVGIVLEWINGRDLRYWLRNHRRPFTPFQIREIMLPVIDAIGYAHEKGIIHRDLKPGNILFHHEGKRVIPKVADFGIAKMLNEVDSRTQTGTMMGTLQYMSPEQIRDSKYVDQRSDIYSLGIILFRMATARLPFREKNALVLMRQHELAAPPTPSDLCPPIPEELDRLILRCLEKDPAHRFQNCDELAAAIEELPEASVHTRASLFPGYLAQPPKDGFGDIADPHPSNAMGVKVFTAEGSDVLPTGAPAQTSGGHRTSTRSGSSSQHPSARRSSSFDSMASMPPSMHRPPTVNLRKAPQLNEQSSAPASLHYAQPSAQQVMPNTNASSPFTPKIQPPSPPEAFSEHASVLPQEVALSEEAATSKPKRSMVWLFVLLCIVTGGSVGGLLLYQKMSSAPTTKPKKLQVRSIQKKKIPKSKIIDQLDTAVDDALRAIKMENLALASKKLKYAMMLPSAKGKKPAWTQTKYYPELYRVAGRVAMGRNQLYNATQYFKRYNTADVRTKSKREQAKHTRETKKLKQKILPQLRAELKKRVSRAEQLLKNMNKQLQKNKPDRAFALYQQLQKTVRSEPHVYQKLARTLRSVYPVVSIAVYQQILDHMLLSKPMASEIRKEQAALTATLQKKNQQIAEEFKKADGWMRSKKYRKLRRWLKQVYLSYQSFPKFHIYLQKLFVRLAAQNTRKASQLMRQYSRLYKRYTQKGFLKWAALSEKPLQIPTYTDLKRMQTIHKSWNAFARILQQVRRLLHRAKIASARSTLRRLPKNWSVQRNQDTWKFYRVLAPAAGQTQGYAALQKAFRTYAASTRHYATDRLQAAKQTQSQLKKQLQEQKKAVSVWIGKRSIQSWIHHISKLQQRATQHQKRLIQARTFRRSKQWKKCSDAYNKHLKAFPRSYRKNTLKRYLDDCNCNQNVPWIPCSKRAKKTRKK